MDIRSVQKTGNMHYVYMPTVWCKKYNITSGTKVSVEANKAGTLTIYPELREQVEKNLTVALPEATPEMLIKLIIACYINPAKSFTIKLSKEANISTLLDKRKSISALEFVELEGNTITHESSISIKDPHSMLKTMVKKVRSLLHSMIEHYDQELINKYEEEIDRSKLLITKSVTGSLALNEPTKLKTVTLYYISMIAQDLERMVDSLILVDKQQTAFFEHLVVISEDLLKLVSSVDKIPLQDVMALGKKIHQVKTPEVTDIKSYGLRRIKTNLMKIVEVLLDWSVTGQLEA